jgi:hypothetical protein
MEKKVIETWRRATSGRERAAREALHLEDIAPQPPRDDEDPRHGRHEDALYSLGAARAVEQNILSNPSSRVREMVP